MDKFTQSHLCHWAEQTIPAHLQFGVIQSIQNLVHDHPNLVETHTWPEMRDLAERNYA